MAKKSKKELEAQNTEKELIENQLNDAQKFFCRLYVTGNMSNAECYMTAYPKASPETAAVNSSRLLKKDNIKRYINILLDELGESVEISDKEIIRELKRIAFHSRNDNAKIKALTTLGTITGLLDKSARNTTTNVINITVDESHAPKQLTNDPNTIAGATFTIIDNDPDEFFDPDEPDNDDNDDNA